MGNGSKLHYWDMINKYSANFQKKNGPVNVATIHRSSMGPRMMNGGQGGMLFTGGGADGKVQPDKPALIDMSSGSPSIVHEGELMRSIPGQGKQVINNEDVRAGVIPLVTEAQQTAVGNLEQNQNGFRHGGMMHQYRGGGLISPVPTPDAFQQVIPGIPIPAFRGGGMIPGYQEGGLINQIEQTPGGLTQALGTPNVPIQPVAGLQPVQGLSATPPPTQDTQFPAPPAQPPVTPPVFGIDQGATSAVTPPPQQQQPAVQPPTPLTQPAAEQKPPVTAQDIQDIGKGEDLKFETPEDFKKLFQKKMQDLLKVSEGDSELFDRLKEQWLGRLGNLHAAQQAAGGQRAAQEELGPETSRLLGQQLGRRQALERGGIQQSLATQQAQQMENAQNQLIQHALTGGQIAQQDLNNQINFLLEQGGVENLNQASDLLTKLYGSPVDLQNLQFKQTMGAISDIVALNLGVEESVKMAIDSGVLERYGITEEQLRSHMTPLIMGSNPIVNAQQMYQDLVGQGIISQQQADQIMDLMTWKLTNPDGVVMTDSVAVVDANGTEISNFQTQAEADQFLAANKGKGYSTQVKQNGWFQLKGTEDDTSIKGKIEGEVFEQGGQLFQVVDGQKVPARMNIGTPFSGVNDKLYEFYLARGDQARANEILNLQVELLRGIQPASGELRLPVGITKDHPAVKWYLENREALPTKDVPIQINSFKDENPGVTVTTKKNKKTTTFDVKGKKVG